MPASVTHELIARRAAELLPEEHDLQTALRSAADCYFLGAQGPDPLFFCRPFLGDNLGRALHRSKMRDVLEAFLTVLRETDGGRARAYACGFVSHCAADALFHPFVYAALKEKGGGKAAHRAVEREWDEYFLGKTGGSYRCPYSCKRIAAEGTVPAFLSRALALLGREISPAKIGRAIVLFGRYRSLSPDKAKPAPAHAGRDGLFIHAAKRSAEAILIFSECLMSGEPLPEEPFSRHLLTGELM